LLIRLYLQAVLRQNVAFFDRLGAGEVTNRVSNDAELIREGISDKVQCNRCWLTQVAIVIQSLAAFFSAFVIAFVKNWKFALILSCIVPLILTIFGVGGGMMAKFAKLQVKEYAAASTIAEEIISSVRTAQAFGTEKKLTNLYDESLVAAQRAGYKQQLAGALTISVMFFSVYAFYGLGFCICSVLII
jgi:ATP-binding cassette, subfamily B (MDR/TAP), member 1